MMSSSQVPVVVLSSDEESDDEDLRIISETHLTSSENNERKRGHENEPILIDSEPEDDAVKQARNDAHTTDNMAEEADTHKKAEKHHYALVTVATLGCGKTTTSLILTHLFPRVFGHIQNDNLSSPIGKKLVSGAIDILKWKPAVILDRNNPVPKERGRVFDDFDSLDRKRQLSRLKYVCLNFVPYKPQGNTELWNNTRERVKRRGNNHQSIQADGAGGITEAERILRTFVKDFEPVDTRTYPDSRFDLVIDLDARGKDSSLSNAKEVVKAMLEFAPELQISQPTEAQYQTAFKKALEYRPAFRKKYWTGRSNSRRGGGWRGRRGRGNQSRWGSNSSWGGHNDRNSAWPW